MKINSGTVSAVAFGIFRYPHVLNEDFGLSYSCIKKSIEIHKCKCMEDVFANMGLIVKDAQKRLGKLLADKMIHNPKGGD